MDDRLKEFIYALGILSPLIMALLISIVLSILDKFKKECNHEKHLKHSWKVISSRYVKGNDIGFGITNSFTTDIVEECVYYGEKRKINFR